VNETNTKAARNFERWRARASGLEPEAGLPARQEPRGRNPIQGARRFWEHAQKRGRSTAGELVQTAEGSSSARARAISVEGRAAYRGLESCGPCGDCRYRRHCVLATWWRR